MMSPIPFFTFNNGLKVPALGIGCWMGLPGRIEKAEEMTRIALKYGYRHIDTASGYANEEAVGKAIRESGIPREEIFVTTKFTIRSDSDARTAIELSLKKLGLDYVDLWLMHWPVSWRDGKAMNPGESPTYVEVWKEMETVYAEGKAKSIGVSNFSVKTLEVLLPEAKIVPVTNQVELHPAYPQTKLLEYCKERNILLTAYSPLGQQNSPFFEDSILQDIASKEGGTIAQVILSWGVLRGTIVIPKSEKEERINENSQILSLSEESMSAVDSWHEGPGKHRPLCGYFPISPGTAMGWTYDQLGWELTWDDAENRVVAV